MLLVGFMLIYVIVLTFFLGYYNTNVSDPLIAETYDLGMALSLCD